MATRSRVPHDHRAGVRCPACHLYSTPEGRRRSLREFKARYGAHGGRSGKGYRYVYGATVGKVARERRAKRRRR